MIPDKQHPIWKDLVTGAKLHDFEVLPAGMMFARMILQTKNNSSPDFINKCVNEAHAFFMKYEKILQDDCQKLFK